MKTILTNSSKKSIKSSTYGLKWMACLSIPLKKFIPTIGFFLYLAFPVLGQTVYNTLQSDDVEIDDDGIIQALTSSGHSRIWGSNLKIPVELDGKKVKGIASKNPGVFENLGIEEVTFEDKSEVNSIGAGAFTDNLIATLTLPEGLTKIGPFAFNSNKIVELTLPTSVTNIGAYSFAPNLLESVIFDGNESNKSMIQVIGEGAFSLNPSSLGSITLPPNGNLGFVNYVDTVGGDYDVGSSITDFTLSYEAKFAYELTGQDINVDTDGIITECYCDNFDIKGITIPASITVGGNQIDIIGIKDGVFKGKEFKFVLIPEGLTSIGRDAFANNMLTHLTLPRSIRYIGESAFRNNKLTSITFEGDGTSGSNIISIGGRAFYDNQGLSIVLPIHSLGSDTGFRYKDSRGNDYEQGADFRDFYRELYVDIPYTLIATDIELDSDGVITECYCNNFESRTFTIPTSISTVNGEEIITGIGANVFKDIFLTTLSFSTESKVTSIGGSAFQYNNLFSITLPQGLGSIGANAFGSNLNLIEITLPKVTKTGYRVYWKGSDEMDGGTNQSIKKREFSKSFELVSIHQVTLTTMIDGGEGGTVSADINPNTENSYDINTEVKLTANPDAGWRFEKWVIEGQAEPVTVSELKLTLTQDTKVTAHFQYQVTLTTSVEGGQGGTVSADITPNAENSYDINTEVKLTANPDAGWRFEKWVIEGQAEPVTVLELKLTLTQDTTVTAHFIQYQVTLTTSVEEGQGGTVSADITPNAENSYAINTEVKLTANPDAGWRFKEWVIEGQAEPVAVSELKLTLTQDTKVTAHFEQYEVTLTTSVEEGQGGTVSADITPNTENRYAIDTEVKLTANPDAGWRFKEWVIEGQAEPVAVLELKLTLTQDTTVTAHFEQYEVTLTTSVEGGQGGTVSVDINPNAEGRYDINTEVKLTANPDASWRFKEWVIEGQAEPVAVSELKLTLTQDTKVTAHFEQYEVTLTTSVEEGQGGTVSADITPNTENRYAIDTEVTLTANPDAGWRFKEWVIEGQADPMTELKLKLTLTQDTEVTAHFVKQVTLTLTIDGSGAVKGLTEGGHSYKKGDVVVLEAEPTQGWRFDKWEIKGQSGYNPNSSMNVTLIRDTEITAFFIQQVTLTASVAGEQGGTINVNLKPNSETFYDINTKIELTAEADNGWRFLRWEVDGDDESNTSQKLSLTLESDAKVTAFFTKEEDGKVTSVLDEERVAFSGFPSPVESLMTIAVSAGDQIVIYNQFGISVYQAVATTTFHAVDMREMPSGVYLLRLTTPEGKLDAIRIVKK